MENISTAPPPPKKKVKSFYCHRILTISLCALVIYKFRVKMFELSSRFFKQLFAQLVLKINIRQFLSTRFCFTNIVFFSISTIIYEYLNISVK